MVGHQLLAQDELDQGQPTADRDLLSDEIMSHVDAFLISLPGGGLSYELESRQIADASLALIRQLINLTGWRTAKQLMLLLKSAGRYMLARCGTADTIVGNMIRRTLKLIREEFRCIESTASSSIAATTTTDDAKAEGDPPYSLQNMISGVKTDDDFSKCVPDLKSRLLQTLDELATELESSGDEISEQALEHIHASEIILTIGRSRTVEHFLKYAAHKGRQFQVIVAECAPSYSGQTLAASLAAAKIPTTLITDSAVFAMMSRVNKVIIGTHSILANGGLQAVAGTYNIALAAESYSVPLIVCAAMTKLSPIYWTAFQDHKLVSPAHILRDFDGQILAKVRAYNPLFEYVPPQLVTSFISNIAGYAPSYIYRQLAELYHPDDYTL